MSELPIKLTIADVFTGRAKILCDESSITPANVVEVLKEAMKTHIRNSNEINTLYEYYKGNQPILGRTKTIRPEINNKIVENRANEIVNFKVGGLCGEPLQYISRGSTDEISRGINELNDMMLLCGKSALDKELIEWAYICGTAYRMIMPNKDYIETTVVPGLEKGKSQFTGDEAPFEIYTLDPRYAFVVYHSGLGEKPLMGVKYIIKKDNKLVFSVYTESKYYEFESDINVANPITKKIEDRKFSENPIIEYPMNNARLGSFEIVLPILDAINTVQSNRLDGVEQFIQSLIVLVNSEISDDAAKLLREAGLITLKSYGDNKPDLRIIAEQLDQQQTQTLVDYMYQTVLNIVGMPNRNGGFSTSDTGSAVIMRDGHSSAESRFKSDELMVKESERKFLKIVLKMIRDTVGTSLRLADIETKFTRRNFENGLVKSQILTTMLASDKIAPALAFANCGLFSDPEDAAKMSAEYYKTVKKEEGRSIEGVPL